MPAMARLVEAARAEGLAHVASADDHELSDDEISDEPDFSADLSAALPAGDPGAERVAATAQRDPVPLALTSVAARWLEAASSCS